MKREQQQRLYGLMKPAIPQGLLAGIGLTAAHTCGVCVPLPNDYTFVLFDVYPTPMCDAFCTDRRGDPTLAAMNVGGV